MKKRLCLVSVLVLLTLFSAVPVKAGVVERQSALEILAATEITVYVGNSGSIGMKDAAHPSILSNLIDAKVKNDNSLNGSTEELISELNLLEQSISGLIPEDGDFEIIQAESETITGFSFTQRLDILNTKIEKIATLVPDCGISNEARRDLVIQRIKLASDILCSIIDRFDVIKVFDIMVNFPDPNLEATIRYALNKPTGDIYASELETLVALLASNEGITDLSGIEYCTNLQRLALYNNNITDVNPLSGLTSLQKLSLGLNQITDISQLSELTSLEFLELQRNQISDISPLLDISPPTGFLNSLYVHYNPLSDDSINVVIPELQAKGVYVSY